MFPSNSISHVVSANEKKTEKLHLENCTELLHFNSHKETETDFENLRIVMRKLQLSGDIRRLLRNL